MSFALRLTVDDFPAIIPEELYYRAQAARNQFRTTGYAPLWAWPGRVRSCLFAGNRGKALLGDECPQRVDRSGELSLVSASQHDVSAEALLLEERIAPDLHPGMRQLKLREPGSHVAFRRIDSYRARKHRPPLGEARHDRVQHHLHDAGHAGHDDHVPDHEAGSPGDGVVDQLRALRDAGHAKPRRRQLL